MTAAAKARLAIVGFGRLGRACAQALHGHERLLLAGVVRRGGAALPAASPGADLAGVERAPSMATRCSSTWRPRCSPWMMWRSWRRRGEAW